MAYTYFVQPKPNDTNIQTGETEEGNLSCSPSVATSWLFNVFHSFYFIIQEHNRILVGAEEALRAAACGTTGFWLHLLVTDWAFLRRCALWLCEVKEMREHRAVICKTEITSKGSACAAGRIKIKNNIWPRQSLESVWVSSGDAAVIPLQTSQRKPRFSSPQQWHHQKCKSVAWKQKWSRACGERGRQRWWRASYNQSRVSTVSTAGFYGLKAQVSL